MKRQWMEFSDHPEGALVICAGCAIEVILRSIPGSDPPRVDVSAITGWHVSKKHLAWCPKCTKPAWAK